MTADFSSETIKAGFKLYNIFNMLGVGAGVGRKDCQSRILYLIKISFRNERKIKAFLAKGK